MKGHDPNLKGGALLLFYMAFPGSGRSRYNVI